MARGPATGRRASCAEAIADWSSSKRGLAVVTGERLEIERLTSRSEEGRWKSTHRGNSLAAYPTTCTVLKPSCDMKSS